MGRGPRQAEQAMRLASLPRRLAQPERIGQRRYSVQQVKYLGPGGSLSEPGYLGALTRELTYPAYCDKSLLTIKEEIAAVDKNGTLRWIPGHDLRHETAHHYQGISSLADARQQCDRLNKYPLGPLVGEEVNNDGDLVISHRQRQLDNYGEIVEVEVDRQTFDVSEPAQAAAQSYHNKLNHLVEQEQEQTATRAADSFRAYWGGQARVF